MSFMKTSSIAIALVVCATVAAPEASAQARRGGGHRGLGAVGRAVPRVYAPRSVVPSARVYAPRIISPRIVGVVPYRPYYYPYRPGLTVGFYSRYGYGYPYRYGYAPYGYGYGYALPPAGYVTAAPGYAYGGVRIQGAPEDAQVYADGYYVGIVDDFDGPFQHLNLQAGAHRIEIRAPGLPPIAFDVNVIPGDTITYHAGLR
jgi:hypothetical protein